MQYTEWKSFKECLPRSNYGLLIKFIIKDDKKDEWNVIGNLFYGYIFPGTDHCLYLTTVIYKNGDVNGMAWKAYKVFDLDEIFWRFDYVHSAEYNQPERLTPET